MPTRGIPTRGHAPEATPNYYSFPSNPNPQKMRVFIFLIIVVYPSLVTSFVHNVVTRLKRQGVIAASQAESVIVTKNAVLSQLAKTTGGGQAKTLTDLIHLSKEACDAVQPMLKAFYDKITKGESSTAKLKSDATFFTIADGIVQHMFIEHLFKPGNKFGNIVGEEDETKVNIMNPPYSVDELVVPAEFNSLISTTLAKIKSLASRIDSQAFKKLTLFVDPIDGTREFATGQGEFVTILLGYNDERGHPCAGIMYRPLTTPVTWAAGAKSENCAIGVLDYAEKPKPNGLLITDGKVSKFLAALIQDLGMERIPSVASGNRAMMILEGKAGAYIRDTGGFAKWDTSGPQVYFL